MVDPFLVGGPYTTPLYVIGEMVDDVVKGPVRIKSTSNAPIPWPCCGHANGSGGLQSPILFGCLVDAVRVESVQAIVFFWRTSAPTVKRWRRALGIGRTNAGTLELYRRLAHEKFSAKHNRR